MLAEMLGLLCDRALAGAALGAGGVLRAAVLAPGRAAAEGADRAAAGAWLATLRCGAGALALGLAWAECELLCGALCEDVRDGARAAL